MSYFLFGVILLPEGASGSLKERVSWRVVAQGVDHGIYLTLEHNIQPRIVVEMLNEQEPSSSMKLRFFATASPIEDNSHSLFVQPSRSPVDSIWRGANDQLAGWLSSILIVGEVAGIRIYITEGYDNAFSRTRLHISEIDSYVRGAKHAGQIPSLCIEVKS